MVFSVPPLPSPRGSSSSFLHSLDVEIALYKRHAPTRSGLSQTGSGWCLTFVNSNVQWFCCSSDPSVRRCSCFIMCGAQPIIRKLNKQIPCQFKQIIPVYDPERQPSMEGKNATAIKNKAVWTEHHHSNPRTDPWT